MTVELINTIQQLAGVLYCLFIGITAAMLLSLTLLHGGE